MKASSDNTLIRMEHIMSDYEINGNKISIRGSKLGELDGNRFRDQSGRTVGEIDGSHLRDASGKRIASLDGSNIRDASGRTIATLDDARKSIRNAIGGASLMGFYLLFVR